MPEEGEEVRWLSEHAGVNRHRGRWPPGRRQTPPMTTPTPKDGKVQVIKGPLLSGQPDRPPDVSDAGHGGGPR